MNESKTPIKDYLDALPEGGPADLTQFSGEQFQAEPGVLAGRCLRYANFHGVDLRGTDLSRADLTRADLSEVNLEGADLTDADLGGANLRYSDLSGVDLRYANLWGADLTGARLYDEEFYDDDTAESKD